MLRKKSSPSAAWSALGWKAKCDRFSVKFRIQAWGASVLNLLWNTEGKAGRRVTIQFKMRQEIIKRYHFDVNILSSWFYLKIDYLISEMHFNNLDCLPMCIIFRRWPSTVLYCSCICILCDYLHILSISWLDTASNICRLFILSQPVILKRQIQ